MTIGTKRYVIPSRYDDFNEDTKDRIKNKSDGSQVKDEKKKEETIEWNEIDVVSIMKDRDTSRRTRLSEEDIHTWKKTLSPLDLRLIQGYDESNSLEGSPLDRPLETPLYLSGTRLLNTPVHSRESHSDKDMRYNMTLSPGGLGTTPTVSKVDSFYVESKSTGCTTPCQVCSVNERTAVQCAFCEHHFCTSCQRRYTAQIDKFRWACFDCVSQKKLALPCSVCGASDNSSHSRSCLKCRQRFCKACKRESMKKLGKKTWVCDVCVSNVRTVAKSPEDAATDCCIRCGAAPQRSSRLCNLCFRPFCGKCKKQKMDKVCANVWLCRAC